MTPQTENSLKGILFLLIFAISVYLTESANNTQLQHNQNKHINYKFQNTVSGHPKIYKTRK